MPKPRSWVTLSVLFVSSRTLFTPKIGAGPRPLPRSRRIGGQSQRGVGVEGVEPLLLQRVRAQFVDEADASPLMASHVDHGAAVGVDAFERRVELGAALAFLRVEGLTREAL